MPIYRKIDPTTPEGVRTLRRLVELRAQLDRDVPAKNDKQILLATWNIREFDSNAYGIRVPEAMNYIAEIVSRFDIIAVSEVRSDLKALRALMSLLGSRWDVVLTDVTSRKAGNGERIAVLYDSAKVRFGGLAGELVIPPIRTTDTDGDTIVVPSSQFARTPLLAGFKAGWVDFMLAVVHIRWGDGHNDPRAEVEQLVEQLSEKADDKYAWSRNIVAIGDFNIGATSDAAYDALRDHGWVIPPDYVTEIEGTNIAQNKFYDQIAVRPRPGYFEIAECDGKPSAGVVNFYETVFQPFADYEEYIPLMKTVKPTATRSNFTFDSDGERRDRPSQERWYRNFWRTHQMSDHLPLWASIRIDNSDDFLQGRLDSQLSPD